RIVPQVMLKHFSISYSSSNIFHIFMGGKNRVILHYLALQPSFWSPRACLDVLDPIQQHIFIFLWVFPFFSCHRGAHLAFSGVHVLLSYVVDAQTTLVCLS